MSNPYYLKKKDTDELPPVLRPPPVKKSLFVYGTNYLRT